MSSELSSFLDYLDKVHARTRRVVVLVPSDAVEWAPAPGRFTFGDLIRHLAGVERWMYAETVHGRPSRYLGHGRELANGKDAAVAYYDALHAEARALFGEMTETQFDAKCHTPAGVSITTSRWLRLMVEHEAHHRGQLYLMLGLRGVPVPQIYGLTEGELISLAKSG